MSAPKEQLTGVMSAKLEITAQRVLTQISSHALLEHMVQIELAKATSVNACHVLQDTTALREVDQLRQHRPENGLRSLVCHQKELYTSVLPSSIALTKA